MIKTVEQLNALREKMQQEMALRRGCADGCTEMAGVCRFWSVAWPAASHQAPWGFITN